jgi:hypothetical protein
MSSSSASRPRPSWPAQNVLPLATHGFAAAGRHLDAGAAVQGDELGGDLAAAASVAGDGGDGGQFDLRVTQGESQGQGVVDVRADVGIEEDASGHGLQCISCLLSSPSIL